MRLLGIDYGTKRIGISISDDGGRLAFPHTTIKNDKSFVSEIKEIVDEYNVKTIVVGESKDYQMKENAIMADVHDLVDELKELLKINVVLHPEFMSSTQVEKTVFQAHDESGRKTKKEQKAKNVDAQAAAIILQSYIDSR
jgi:putative Holliday junction resolvase